MNEEKKVTLTLSLDVDEVIRQLVSTASREQLMEAIKQIDLEMQDWDFTLQLADHFSALKVEYGRELASDEGDARSTVDIRPPRDA